MAEQHYLVGLDLAGKRVVVVGGGMVAQRRLPKLLATGADVHLVSPEATPSVEAMAAGGELTWHRRPYADGDLAASWYVLTCTSDSEVNAAVSVEAERERVFCVRADAGDEGSAVTPATGSYGGLLVGVLAGGEHQRSAAVRDLPGVALVGGGPGDPELITVRGRRLLARADVVVADRLGPRDLLDELPPEVEVIDAAKIPYGRSATQDAINRALIDNVKAGKFVVRLKGGDPYLFGRGYEELLALAQEGIPVTVVPGITSAFAVPALAEVPVTHRGMAHEVVVVSGHVGPDDPASLTDWSALARMSGTIVLMMGVDKLARFADALISGGRPADTPVVVVQEGTMPTERVLRSTLAEVAEDVADEGIRPPAVTIIGPVAGLAAQR